MQRPPDGIPPDLPPNDAQNGVRRAMRVETRNPAEGSTVMVFEEFESGLDLEDDVFFITED